MSEALDRFFDHYRRARPVNATFTGWHEYDHVLPDWSPAGVAAMASEMRTLLTSLTVAPVRSGAGPNAALDWNALDAELASAFLEIQIAEMDGGFGVRANPSLWTGEAVFSVIALMIRPFAPFRERVLAAVARLDAIPAFLAHARETLGARPIPGPWLAHALRDCEGARLLFTRGVEAWLTSAPCPHADTALLRAAAARAADAFRRCAGWLADHPRAGDDALACGPEFFDLLLTRGHQCARARADLLADARSRFAEARATLNAAARATFGSWGAVQQRLGDDHPAAADYFGAFERTWQSCRACAEANDVVTWPEWPIRYVPYPEWTRDAAPYLYYLHYRAPAPHDAYTLYDYVVPALDEATAERQLRAWNHAVIKLNHVVHHGAIGHHVQNWHAYHRAPSRIGQIAAVDCACRIGMFCGGTMAEGWACYATELMEELGFLSPLERLSQQHSRVRFLARAIVDIELHQRSMSFDDAIRFYVEQVAMPPEAARAEATKNAMFPCTGIMYWLGTQGILDLRETLRRRQGAAFSLRRFHDELLSFGSLPVPLVARLMTERAA